VGTIQYLSVGIIDSKWSVEIRGITMRCGEAKRELSVSRGERSAELGAHLAHCESCAAWAESCERFDALWDATRPVATDQAFASVWNRVTSAGSSRPARAAWLRFAPRVLAGTAAIAAAALFFVFVAFHSDRHVGVGGFADSHQARPEIVRLVLLEEGQTPIIDLEKHEVTRVNSDDDDSLAVNLDEPKLSSIDNLVLFNAFEAMAQ
jgi:hypothetical protein